MKTQKHRDAIGVTLWVMASVSMLFFTCFMIIEFLPKEASMWWGLPTGLLSGISLIVIFIITALKVDMFATNIISGKYEKELKTEEEKDD